MAKHLILLWRDHAARIMQLRSPQRMGAAALLVAALAILLVTLAMLASALLSPPAAPDRSGVQLMPWPADHAVLRRDRIGPIQEFQQQWTRLPADRFVPTADGKIAERAPGPATAAAGDMLSLPAPYAALDAGSFSAGDWIVRLHGVEGPGRDAVCLDKDDAPFACGLHARAALTNIMTGATVTCAAHAAPAGDTIEGTCQTAQGNVAALMARKGWLRPISAASAQGPLAAATQAAQEARAGMWAGGWRYRPGNSPPRRSAIEALPEARRQQP
jgi:endonuclease YncB( thermonuclease family)